MNKPIKKIIKDIHKEDAWYVFKDKLIGKEIIITENIRDNQRIISSPGIHNDFFACRGTVDNTGITNEDSTLFVFFAVQFEEDTEWKNED